MKRFIYLLSIIFCISFFFSCQKQFTEDPGLPLDTDADLFIKTAQITDLLEQAALNKFVIELKQDSLWTKFAALYPMIGGTSSSTKWNLKDPRDSDSAYRITWNGTPTFTSTGVTCSTKNDWGDTHLKDNSLTFTYDNASMSFYSGTQNQIAGYDMGCGNQRYPYNILAIYEDFNVDVVNTFYDAFGQDPHQPANTVGLFTTSSYKGDVVRYDNGAAVAHYGAPKDVYTTLSFTIGNVLDDPHQGLRECRLAALGQGMSDAEALKFYNAVKNFQTSLGR